MKKLIAAVLLAVMCTALLGAALAEEPTYATTVSFITVLDEENLAYTFDGKNTDGYEQVWLINVDENFEYAINVYFHEDEDVATVRVWNIITYDGANYANVLRAVNSLNGNYKYVRFFVDESDNTVNLGMEIVLQDNDDAGEIVLEGVLRIANILEGAYTQISVYAH